MCNHVVKRDGRIVQFDPKKIYAAISAANRNFKNTDHELSEEDVRSITDKVMAKCNSYDRNVSVEEIQDFVEREISKISFEVAKHYITYRYTHSLIRQKNTTDEKILDLIGLHSQEAKDENSNKNPVINSTQRDYMAGEVSKDLTERILLPKEIVEAHKKGIIHFHDSDYYAQHMHNCFSGDTKFITDTGVRSFDSFNDGDKVYVKDFNGETRLATVHSYGEQELYSVTLQNGKMRKTVSCTKNHRWVLDDGSITTNLSIGDKIFKTPVNRESFDYITTQKSFTLSLGYMIAEMSYPIINNYDNGYQDIDHVRELFGDDYCIDNYKVMINTFLRSSAWRDLNDYGKYLLFTGFIWYGNSVNNLTEIEVVNPFVARMIREISGIAGYYIYSESYNHINSEDEDVGEYDLYDFEFVNDTDTLWEVVSIEFSKKDVVWCVEEPATHTFLIEGGIVTGNCDLVNLDDMLQNGTVITGTLIEKPHSFSTACNIATQIIAQVASNQYGGQSITLRDLAPFVDISRKKIRTNVLKEFEVSGITSVSEEEINKIVEMRVRDEVKRGVQTIQYQVVTLLTTNGQAPFITVFMYLNEARNEQEKKDLAMIIEEVLIQRYQGVKNECGVWITPAFPKLVYVLEEDNIHEDSKYWYLTELAAKCTSRRLVPDYVSEKMMLKLKGDVYPPMGCRSFLTPDRFTDTGTLGNVANAKNYDPTKHKYYGRFNQGVITINLPYIALLSGGDKDKFWEIFEDYLELCHRALRLRHERLLGTPSDVAPILWQYGAIARLNKGETIDKLLYKGYSTISLGYAGLYECVRYMTGVSHTETEVGRPFAISVMQKMNDMCAKWKAAEDIDYSLYGTPMESTTYKFAKALKDNFGVIEGVSDKDYITNSYHVHVTEKINAFDKLKFESDFQALSPGGNINNITFCSYPKLREQYYKTGVFQR